ncbi:hypothetical protein Hanom_Chr16g01452701 [Helianthus anomalus]
MMQHLNRADPITRYCLLPQRCRILQRNESVHMRQRHFKTEIPINRHLLHFLFLHIIFINRVSRQLEHHISTVSCHENRNQTRYVIIHIDGVPFDPYTYTFISLQCPYLNSVNRHLSNKVQQRAVFH